MSDPFHEYEDRLLCEEHALHPERFHKYETMSTKFRNHAESIGSQALRYACLDILKEPRFLTWPASLSFHHDYEGGLLTHTIEVCDIAEGISISSAGIRAQSIDRDVLIAAALWHDFCKVREYEKVSTPKQGQRSLLVPGTYPSEKYWVGTPYSKEIHHIPGSAIAFTLAAENHGVPQSTIEAVQHCILAHHGRREWGSPVEPQTIEALILHQADMLSAKFGATKEN